MEHLVCNRCGKKLKIENGIAKEDCLQVCKSWGYFSKKDGNTQEFILCEDCVGIIAKDFVIPAKFSETTELL